MILILTLTLTLTFNDLCLFDFYNLLHFTYPQCQK